MLKNEPATDLMPEILWSVAGSFFNCIIVLNTTTKAVKASFPGFILMANLGHQLGISEESAAYHRSETLVVSIAGSFFMDFNSSMH